MFLTSHYKYNLYKGLWILLIALVCSNVTPNSKWFVWGPAFVDTLDSFFANSIEIFISITKEKNDQN